MTLAIVDLKAASSNMVSYISVIQSQVLISKLFKECRGFCWLNVEFQIFLSLRGTLSDRFLDENQ